MKLKEIAERLNAHLQRWEADPEINWTYSTPTTRGFRPYYEAGAVACGNKVAVAYVKYQGFCYLTKTEALAYLRWIEAGNVGHHWKMRREQAPTP